MNRPSGGSGTTTKPRVPNRSGVARAATPAQSNTRAREFIDGIISEMRRVTWPSRQEWVGATILTILLVAAVALYTFSLDKIFIFIFGQLHK